ncbi:MAG: transposase family protein [Candidatus Brocadia sp.]|nr:MAG: transposase family protein [Candidatus Brocadia sp.]
MKREKLPWLANNPFYTKRFAHYVGRKCRAMTVKDVAKELKLDWHTVKALEKEYLQGAVAAQSCCSAQGNRDRRNISEERAYLPNRGQRSGKREADLVWWRGSLRGES